MDSRDLAKSYDKYYYSDYCGMVYHHNERLREFFGSTASRIVQGINPETFLDAGCAMGILVGELRNLGVEAWGIDISEYAIGAVNSEIKKYCSLGSVAEPLNRNYSLISCIEVLEHLPSQEAELAVENLCKHTDDILFSSTPFEYKEATHINVQPPEYWVELFAQQGFFRDVDFDASFISPWSIRFRRRNEPLKRIVREYERKFWLLWQENSGTRTSVIEMRDKLAVKEENIQLLNKEIENLKEQMQDLKEKLSTSQLELSQVQGNLDTSQSKLDKLQAELNSSQIKQKQMEENLSKLPSYEGYDSEEIYHSLIHSLPC